VPQLIVVILIIISILLELMTIAIYCSLPITTSVSDKKLIRKLNLCILIIILLLYTWCSLAWRTKPSTNEWKILKVYPLQTYICNDGIVKQLVVLDSGTIIDVTMDYHQVYSSDSKLIHRYFPGKYTYGIYLPSSNFYEVTNSVK
jgi:hypothetical protein